METIFFWIENRRNYTKNSRADYITAMVICCMDRCGRLTTDAVGVKHF